MLRQSQEDRAGVADRSSLKEIERVLKEEARRAKKCVPAGHRIRPSKACEPGRWRKTKCNGSTPCDQCSRRKTGDDGHYKTSHSELEESSQSPQNGQQQHDGENAHQIHKNLLWGIPKLTRAAQDYPGQNYWRSYSTMPILWSPNYVT